MFCERGVDHASLSGYLSQLSARLSQMLRGVEALQDRQRVQRQQKKAYLDYYNDLCLTMTRQFRSLSPSRLIR